VWAAQAFDWGDLLVMLCAHADDVRVLLSRDVDLTADKVLRCIRFSDVDEEANSAAARGYLQAFLRTCPPLVLRQFVARATTSLDAAKPVVVSVGDQAAGITFVRRNGLVRPYN